MSKSEKKKQLSTGKIIGVSCGSLLGLFIVIIVIAAIFGSGDPRFDKVKSPTNQSPITLSAKNAYKNAKIDFYQDGTKTQELKSDGNGKFSIKVDLKEGNNKFKATATNDKGKIRTSLEINIVYDITPPPISLIQPQSPTENEKIEIQGESEKNAEIKLLKDGKEIANQNTKDSKFVFKNINLVAGENKFSANAFDKAGNKSESKEITVVFNDPRPAEEKRKAEEEAAAKAKQEAEARAKAEQAAVDKARQEEETEYLKQASNISDENSQLLKYFSNFISQKPNPLFWTDDEKLKLAMSMGFIQNNYNRAKELQPPARFKDAHNIFLESLKKFSDAMDLMAQGIDGLDANKIQKASDLMAEGTTLTQQAMAKFLELKQ